MAVHALEPDGLGGIWVGGKASGDGDVQLRHIDANGFNVPYAVTDGPVDEIEAAGAELFLAGAFGEIAGERRWNLGSIDLSTGRATRFRPEPGTSPRVSNDVTMLEALPGGGLLVGGGFQYLAAAAVPGLARFAAGWPRSARPHREAPHRSWSAVWPPARCSGSMAATSPATRRSRCPGSVGAGATCTDAGQVGWSYNLRDADAGHRMRAVLVAHNDAGSFELETAPGPVALGPKPFAIYPAYPYMYGDTARRRHAHHGRRPAGTRRRRRSATRGRAATTTSAAARSPARPAAPTRRRAPTPASASGPPSTRSTPPASARSAPRRRSARSSPTRPGGSEWGKIPTPTFGSKVGDFLYGDRHIGSQSSSGRIGWLRCDASGANCTRLGERAAGVRAPAGRPRSHVPSDTDDLHDQRRVARRTRRSRSPVIGPPYVPTPTPTPNPDPPPTPVPTPPANSWPTGTSTPVPTSTPAPTAAPGPTVTASPGPTISPASPDPTASPAPTATPNLPGAPLPEPTRSPLPGRTGSPATRARAARHRDPPARRPRAPARHRQGHRDRAGPRQRPSASSPGARSRSPRHQDRTRREGPPRRVRRGGLALGSVLAVRCASRSHRGGRERRFGSRGANGSDGRAAASRTSGAQSSSPLHLGPDRMLSS